MFLAYTSFPLRLFNVAISTPLPVQFGILLVALFGLIPNAWRDPTAPEAHLSWRDDH